MGTCVKSTPERRTEDFNFCISAPLTNQSELRIITVGTEKRTALEGGDKTTTLDALGFTKDALHQSSLPPHMSGDATTDVSCMTGEEGSHSNEPRCPTGTYAKPLTRRLGRSLGFQVHLSHKNSDGR